MNTKLLFIPALLAFISEIAIAQTVTVTQTQLPAGIGQTSQRILLINITNSSGTLNTITMNMNGTTATSDATKISVISTGTSNRFYSTQTVFGSTTSIGTGNKSITGSKTLSKGSNNYFWIVYDVSATATEGNVLDATCVSVKVGRSTKTVNASPSGSSLIILQHSIVFKSGDQVTDGGVSKASTYFRIPAIITAANGDLITATDARFNSPNDLPSKSDIVIKRSTDKGVTWLAPQTIADLGSTTGAGDASLTLDKTNGNIICLFASNNGLAASSPSNPIRIRMCISSDNGITWTAPVDLTNQIYGSGCSNPVTQNWYAVWISSGRQLQLSSGRLVAVVGVRTTSSTTINNTVIYSDDHGTTWNIITSVTNNNPAGDGFTGDESKAVQLNNGNLMMSSRTSINGPRVFRTSTDSGSTWSAYTTQSNMHDPKCNGDFIRYSSTLSGASQNILLHSLPNSTTTTRQNLTVFASQDEGATFPVSKTIFPGLAQYSSLTVLPDNTIGMYYEMADPGAPFEMYYARFSLTLVGISGFSPTVNNISFAGQLLSSNQVQLNWETKLDYNISHFEVERSTDRKKFVMIDNASTINPFTSIDKSPSPGVNFYRLKIIGIDGSVQYSKAISINNDRPVSMSLYPNPSSDQLTIQLNTGITENVKIQAIDFSGKVILNKLYSVSSGINTINLNIKSWLPELYFIRVVNNNNKLMFAQKFVKQ